MMGEPTLEEMAQAFERGRARVAEAEARFAAVEPEYKAARNALHDARTAVELLAKAMDAAKRRHLIERAVEEAGVSTDAPAVFVLPKFRDVMRYDLVAVGREGSALYLHAPEHSHRYQGKTYARLRRAGDVARKGFTGEGVKFVRDSDERLVEWWTRGRDQWSVSGAGSSGAVKPLPPPEGGKWRWLRVREQEALAASIGLGVSGRARA